MSTLEIMLTEQQLSFIDRKVASGRFASREDVLAAGLTTLQKKDEEDTSKMVALRAAIAQGDASGIAEGDIDDVFARVRQRAAQLVRSA